MLSGAPNDEYPKSVLGNTICQFYLSEYSKMIPKSAGLTAVGFSAANIDATATDAMREDVLRNRHTAIQQKVQTRIKLCLNI